MAALSRSWPIARVSLSASPYAGSGPRGASSRRPPRGRRPGREGCWQRRGPPTGVCCCATWWRPGWSTTSCTKRRGPIFSLGRRFSGERFPGRAKERAMRRRRATLSAPPSHLGGGRLRVTPAAAGRQPLPLRLLLRPHFFPRSPACLPACGPLSLACAAVPLSLSSAPPPQHPAPRLLLPGWGGVQSM